MTFLVPGENTSRAEASALTYDVFVVHATADESFVQGYLLPELGFTPERVLVPNKLRPGRPLISEIERGVRSSRVTVVVLTPAYMADHWAVFGEQLAAYASLAQDLQGELLPLMLADCELPLHIQALVKLDYRDPTREVWAAETGRLRQYFDLPAVPEQDLPCPYPGMRPFTEQDASRFFGRDAELDDIVRRLRRGEREIYVIGASGSGKSSMIAAGLVPTLTCRTSGLPCFHVRTIRPGERPLERLADVLEADLAAPAAAVNQLLARRAPATSLLLVIDQLEELFALASADQRPGFVAAVRALRADPRCVLVFTLRADFYGAFMESTLWSDVDGRISRIELGALRDDSLRMVIERPARDLGVYFQSELVLQLLWDTAREPGALPLLQEALFQLWVKRRNRLLALADYQALGDGTRTGLAVAVAEHANAVLRTLTRAQETIALRILLRLVNFGEGRADTRRQQLRAVLHSDGEDVADFDTVLQRLIDNRLVTVTGNDERGDVHVDLAHEILIHAWRTFVDWIRTWRADEQRRREFESAAMAWRARGSGNGGLFDPVELAVAVTWRASAAHQLGQSTDLAAFLTASKAAQVQAIQQRRQRIVLVVAPLLIFGTISVIRIIVERNRARAAEALAIQEGQEKKLRAEQLNLALARSNVEVNPTKSVAMLKPLAGKYWREVRATAAAARAAGVAWSLPASNQTRSLELSRDGLRVLSVSSDGEVRIHDLGNRSSQPSLELHTPVDGARFADGDRQIVLWHDTALMLLDASSGKRRDVTAPQPIVDLEVVGTTAYWVDKQHALWQFDLAGTAPVEIPLKDPVRSLSPSPDGRWIALTSDDQLLLYDRTQPDARLRQVAAGDTRDLQWSPSGDHLAAMIAHSATDEEAFDVAMRPEPRTVQLVTMPLSPAVASRQDIAPQNQRCSSRDSVRFQPIANHQAAPSHWFVAASGGRMYAVGQSGVLIAARDEPASFRQIRGDAVGVVESRGGTIVAGATGGLTVISEDGDHVLPLHAAQVKSILASPRSPYVIAQLADRLLVWNLDDIQPRRLTDELPNGALFATGDQVITGGTSGMDEAPAQSINAVTGAAQPLGDWLGLRAVAAPLGGQSMALIDGARHVHLVGHGRTPEDLPGEIDIAGFATPDKLVLATRDGAIYMHDVENHQRTPLGPHPSPLIGFAWGRGHHPWVAAAFIDGTLWRKNLVSGVEATTARVPKLDHVTQCDGKLIVGNDGTVLFLHDSGVHAWRADGAIELLAQTPKVIDDFGETGTSDIIAVANDSTIYAIARDGQNQVTEALPSIDGTSASLSPETGLLVVLDHGAIDIVDPLAHQQWTLTPAGSVTFSDPVISANGHRVLAKVDPGVPTLPKHLVVWSLELPEGPEETVKWLDAMTNAVDDLSPRGLGWR